MSRQLRSYIFGGLLGAAVIAVVCFLASFLTARHVDNVVSDKIKNRQLFEAIGTQAYRALGQGTDEYQMSKLKALAEQGLPLSSTLLAWAYEKQGQTDQRDALLLESMDTMTDPDLLGFLTVMAPTFDGNEKSAVAYLEAANSNTSAIQKLSHSMPTHLQGNDLQRLRDCFKTLNDTFSQDNGKLQNRYAYFSDKKSCRIKKGTQDADPVGT
jgi:hypothetical protein